MTSDVDAEFTSFAAATSSRLLGTAYLLCGDWHMAEDLTQTALAKVFVSWHRISKKDAALAYARRALLNTYLMERRGKRWREGGAHGWPGVIDRRIAVAGYGRLPVSTSQPVARSRNRRQQNGMHAR